MRRLPETLIYDPAGFLAHQARGPIGWSMSGVGAQIERSLDEGGGPGGIDGCRYPAFGRQGDEALVDGLAPGIRVVSRGGGAVRRALLLGSGTPEGHVH